MTLLPFALHLFKGLFMLKKSFVLLSSLFLLSSVATAAETHHYPKAEAVQKQNIPSAGAAGYCQIEIINLSNNRIRVYGVFDDGVPLSPFDIYPRDYPHYIDLFYYGYCHQMMNLYIDDGFGYHLYGGYTEVGTSLYVNSIWNAKTAKAEVTVKHKS